MTTSPDPSGDRPQGGAQKEPMAPGDEAPPGTPGTGPKVCPACGGTGRVAGRTCPTCQGAGEITAGVGGA